MILYNKQYCKKIACLCYTVSKDICRQGDSTRAEHTSQIPTRTWRWVRISGPPKKRNHLQTTFSPTHFRRSSLFGVSKYVECFGKIGVNLCEILKFRNQTKSQSIVFIDWKTVTAPWRKNSVPSRYKVCKSSDIPAWTLLQLAAFLFSLCRQNFGFV